MPTTLDALYLSRPSGEVHSLGGETMGTSWTVRCVARSPRADELRAIIERTLKSVIDGFSPWEAQSELSRFNRSGPGAWQSVSPAFASVVGAALQVANETGGACDPAIGSLVDLWGFGPAPSARRVPDEAAIAHALARAGWRQIELGSAALRMRRTGPVRLDLCGIAKGFAVDLVAGALRDARVASALVEIGGELTGFGVKQDGTPWWVSVDRAGNASLPLLVAMSGLSIATSGCERSFRENGSTYSHTIDPRTGRPIRTGMLSVSVLHRSCMMADAYATALMVMGPGDAIAFAERIGLAAIIEYESASSDSPIREDMSPALRAMLG